MDSPAMNYIPKSGRNASLFEAIEMNDRARVSVLLNKEKTNVDVLDKEKFSPLLYAVRQKNFAIASDLLAHNASVDFGGGIYGSPLHVATVNIDPSMAALLLQYGADPNYRDGDGHTPLHVLFSVFDSGAERSIALSLFLLMRGADPNALGNENWAALHLATKRNQEQALKFVADCSRIKRTFTAGGRVPGNSLASVREFDINIPGGPQRWTPLHIAAREGSTAALRILLQSGANPLQINTLGRSAREVCGGQFECHKLLQRAEKDWLWWKVFAIREDPLSSGARSPAIRSTLISHTKDASTHPTRQLSRSWSLNSSVNSVASRRSLRKMKTRRFAQSAFGLDSDLGSEFTQSNASPLASRSSPLLTAGLTTKVSPDQDDVFDRSKLITDLTEFLEPDISFDLDDLQIMQFNEFINKMIRSNTTLTPPADFYWSNEVFHGSPVSTIRQEFPQSCPIPASYIQPTPVDSEQDYESREEPALARLPSPQLSGEMQAPLTARTHRRIWSSSTERVVPMPTVLRTNNPDDHQNENVSSETPVSSRLVLRFASNTAVNVRTPSVRDQRPCQSSPGEESVRLNTIMSVLTSSETADDNDSITAACRRSPVYSYYLVLASKAPMAECPYTMKKSIGFLMACMNQFSGKSQCRLTHLTDLYKVALSPGLRHACALLCQFTIATLAGDLRLSNSLESVTIDTEPTPTAEILHQILYLFALHNDEPSLRQLFQRLSVDELISLRSVCVRKSTLISRCLTEERCRENTILLLLAYLPYDNRSNAFELHTAVKRRMLYVTRLLLLQGANPSMTNSAGHNALHIAVLYRCRIILLALLYYPGLDINLRPKLSNGTYGSTALELALARGNVYAISALINRGACIHLLDGEDDRWTSRVRKDGSDIGQDMTSCVSDPTKKPLLAAVLEANHVRAELINEVTRHVIPYIQRKRAADPRKELARFRSSVSLMPGLALGPPVIVRSTLRADAVGDSTRLQLKRPSMLLQSVHVPGIREINEPFTSRCLIPIRVCNFCPPGAARRRSSQSSLAGVLGECLNCSSPLCTACAISLERIAQAAVPLLQDLTRDPSPTGAETSSVTNLAVQYSSISRSSPNNGSVSARSKPVTAVACVTVAETCRDHTHSSLEQALSAAPKGILDVLSQQGGSLEAVWCSDSLVVSSGVCGLISKKDLAIEDHCALMTGLHSVFRRLLHSLNYALISTQRPPTRKKTVALCTPRASQVRDGKPAQEAHKEERASAYGTSGVAHIVAEELWLGKNNAMQQMMRTAEVLSLCPFCATYLTSTPCLLRRV